MRFQSKSWQLVLFGVALAACLALAGCADAPPTPTAIWLSPTPTPVALVASATASPAPTATPSPTPTPTLTPTPSLTPSPTPTPTRVPTRTPTPQPSALLDEGQRHRINGDYELAIAAYLALLADAPTPEQAREARYRLAESYLLNRDYAAAATAWEEFIAAYPDDGRLPQARLMAARAYHAGNDCARAVPLYQAYLDGGTPLADLVHEWIGDCLAAEGRLDEAIIAYRQAVKATDDRGVEVSQREKIAGICLARQDYEAAVAEYDAILKIARIDTYRAKIEVLAGQALAAAGQTEAAHERYGRAVAGNPRAEFAYVALVELVDAGVPVDELQRGLIDYYAGANYPDAYGAAIRAFDRYLAASAAAEKADEALYYKALTQRALEQPEAALETLEELIGGYPQSERLPAAWREKAVTLAWLGDNDAAVKAYQDLAAFFPAHELAPEALWQAARIREREGALADAARLYESVQANFPGYEDAAQALWWAGLAHYRAGDSEKAVADWQALLTNYPPSVYVPKARYWLGKLGAKPPDKDAAGYWDQLVAAEPNTYYGLRVELARAGQSLTSTRLISEPVQSPPWDPAQAEAELLPWLQSWTQVPTDTTLLALPEALARSSDFQRGEELLAVGQRTEALAAFDGVRAAAWDDPLALAQVAFAFRERDLHGLAARSAARLAGLWPDGTIRDAPLALQYLAYPLAYADLLSAEAQARGLDPLLLAALIRQESLFEPAAESYAGARGLGQVMPATGEGIARSLDVEDFVLDDLYRPSVSVRFGAYYLAVQMGRFDDQVLIALAAYNGGPGNTLRWLEAGGEDLDLFVEVITAAQSRIYLQKVYEQYLIYESLYRPEEAKEP